jgi:hypothetical protein
MTAGAESLKGSHRMGGRTKLAEKKEAQATIERMVFVVYSKYCT